MTTTPTQVAHPRKASLRTIVQALAGQVLALAAIIPVLALVAPKFLDALGTLLPPAVYAYLAGAVAFIAVLSGAVARIMAIPGVNAWLTRIKLGATPTV